MMINVEVFFDKLIKNNIDYFVGVPDSLLKSFCAYVTDNAKKHEIAVNEGSAIALASGYYLATSKIPLVYMQNSGLGNAINPLLSLADEKVYSIPMILLIGWRGEPNVKDEPQHIKQGEVTIELLKAMKIPFEILDETNLDKQIQTCYKYIKENSSPFAFIVKKNTFSDYKLQNIKNDFSKISREYAIKFCIENIDEKSVFVSTTGMASRELFELRESRGQGHEKDFLCVGSMGHASAIALNIAKEHRNRQIICFDGDGAVLMHLGSLASIGSSEISNFTHIVLNNKAHDSVGAQPTIAGKIDLCSIASACGYKYTASTDNIDELNRILKLSKDKLSFIEIKVKKGSRKDLGRPTTTPKENKINFMKYLEGEK